MASDPLYETILHRLADPLDAHEFERCAQDLLRDAYSSLAPIEGGDDAGMDGAIGTAEGPYPLICTISADVIGNVRRNLEMYLSKRAGPRRAVVATTQALTPAKKRNIEDAAGKLGVVIVNIHDRPDFANRLYRDPAWRKRLLGISGDPPALSRLPHGARGPFTEVMVGRDSDLDWLRTQNGDLLISGQPGSGKTYLHQALANTGDCLFAVDFDRGRLADAIRAQAAGVIVVDDAHVKLDQLATLIQLRAEVGASYRIHANCWPGNEAQVRRLMKIQPTSVRALEPLPRLDIVKLIERLGIVGPDPLLALLLDQCDGKPGLAVVLVEACKIHGTSRVWSGEALADELLANRRLVGGIEDRCILAALALGDDAGMDIQTLAPLLGLSPTVVTAAVTTLGAGGIVEQAAAGRLQVRPPALRAVLVREMFLSSPCALNLTELLAIAPPGAPAHVLMGARMRGADVAMDLIERQVLRKGRQDAWEHFAWVDERCARFILAEHPEHVVEAAPGLLHFAEAPTLPLLLQAAAREDAKAAGLTRTGRGRLKGWLTPQAESVPDHGQRRGRLLHVLVAYRQQHGAEADEITAWVLAEMLEPDFSHAYVKPGDGRQVTFTRGVLPIQDLEQIAALWPKMLSIIGELPVAQWRPILNQVSSWCFPGQHSIHVSLPEQSSALLLAHGARMIADIAAQPAATRAVRTWAADTSRQARLSLSIQVDPDCQLLYGAERYQGDWQKAQEEKKRALDVLAESLAHLPAGVVVAHLNSLDRDAAEIELRRGDWTLTWVYRRLAELTQSPLDWLNALCADKASPNLLTPFLQVMWARDQHATLKWLAIFLDQPSYIQFAAK